MKKMLKILTDGQNDVTQVKLFIMTMKSLLEVQNTNYSEFGCSAIKDTPSKSCSVFCLS